jgi:hypothetical protein
MSRFFRAWAVAAVYNPKHANHRLADVGVPAPSHFPGAFHRRVVGGAQNIVAYLAYAAGFAVGNYAGMLIEEKLAIGTLVVRVIPP